MTSKVKIISKLKINIEFEDDLNIVRHPKTKLIIKTQKGVMNEKTTT